MVLISIVCVLETSLNVTGEEKEEPLLISVTSTLRSPLYHPPTGVKFWLPPSLSSDWYNASGNLALTDCTLPDVLVSSVR